MTVSLPLSVALSNAYPFNFFASVKRFIDRFVALFFAISKVLLLHHFPSLPPLP
jgi:hypothetical protein